MELYYFIIGFVFYYAGIVLTACVFISDRWPKLPLRARLYCGVWPAFWLVVLYLSIRDFVKDRLHA